jgi:hypothetical protein
MNLSDYNQIPSPAFVLDIKRFRKNLHLLKEIQDKTGIHIILALKGFSLWHIFPHIKEYLAGATASSFHEALLIFNEIILEKYQSLDYGFVSAYIIIKHIVDPKSILDAIYIFPQDLILFLNENICSQ